MKPFLTLLPLALLLTVPHAQKSNNRVGMVDVEKLIAAVPGSSNYLTLRKKVAADLSKRQQSIRALTVKANATRSKTDIAAVQKAQQSYLTAQKDYNARLAKELKPLASKVDNAIALTAKNNGYRVILDKSVAVPSKLVIYANSATDLTAAALKAIKK